MHVREPLTEPTWRDANGRVHKRYAVRFMGSNRGFMVVDIYRNVAMATDFGTRESAHEWMQENEDTVLKAGKL